MFSVSYNPSSRTSSEFNLVKPNEKYYPAKWFWPFVKTNCIDVLSDCSKEELRGCLPEMFHRVELWSEELSENLAMSLLHKIVSPLSKLFVGSHIRHEFVLFRSLQYFVAIEFVNDNRIKIRISTDLDYAMKERKKVELFDDKKGSKSTKCTLKDILVKC